jgi:hypothetical protein
MPTDNNSAGKSRLAAQPESPVVAALTELTARLSAETGDFDEFEGPVYWPTREPERAEWDWPSLAQWVARLRARFPHMTARIPDCWYLHNDLVEALLALRDHERVSYASTAPGAAAVEWHRAFRDMEARWDSWIKRYTCTVPGKGHPPTFDASNPQGFAEFVKADLARRQAAGADSGAQELTGPGLGGHRAHPDHRA